MLKRFIKGILKYPLILFNKVFLYFYYKYSGRGYYSRAVCPNGGNNKVLFVAPHVDDEIIGAGATLLKHRELGDTIICLYVTDGGGAVSSLDQESLIHMRKEEAKEIKAELGMERLYFLDIPDGQIRVEDEYIQGVYSILTKEEPDIIYIPFLLDGHIDHVNSSRLLIESISQWDDDFNNIYMYRVNTPIRPDVINSITVLDKDLFDRKNDLYKVFKSQYVMGFDAFMLVDRMSGLLTEEGYALEGFVKADLNVIQQFDDILKEENFNPYVFRQLSSRYNLFFSYMINKGLKDRYLDLFKELLMAPYQAGSKGE